VYASIVMKQSSLLRHAWPLTPVLPCPCRLQPLSITLRGITNDAVDSSIDTWRTVALPLLRKAGGLDESSAGGSLELRVVRRGARPAGGGEVQLRVPLVRQLPRVVMTDEGMVKRIRGISYSMKVRWRLQHRRLRTLNAGRSSCSSWRMTGLVTGTAVMLLCHGTSCSM
jgi:RNA 3'-terminal phosphate cyclase